MEKLGTQTLISDFFRTIRTNIELNKELQAPRTILITSVDSGEGKSFICANLAMSYVQAEKKVLVVDFDIKTGIQHKIYKIENTMGVSNILMEKSYQLDSYIRHTSIQNIDVITSGEFIVDSADILDKSKLEKIVIELKQKYDIILFDGISALIANDSLVLASIVDSTIVVVQYGKTKIEDLERVKKNILYVGGKISGAIMNHIPQYTKEYKEVEKYKIKEFSKRSMKGLIKEKARKILKQEERQIDEEI